MIDIGVYFRSSGTAISLLLILLPQPKWLESRAESKTKKMCGLALAGTEPLKRPENCVIYEIR
jgi:hypothetical protein